MTVPVQSAEAAYEGDGATVRFSIPAGWRDAAHVFVSVAGDTLEQGVDFTVDEGDGEVVLETAPAEGAVVAVWRRTPASQAKAFPNTDSVTPKSIEDGLDLEALRGQEDRARLDRALATPIGEAGLTLPAAGDRAGLVLGFTDTGDIDLTLTRAQLVDEAAGTITAVALGQIEAAGGARVGDVNAAADLVLNPETGTLPAAAAAALLTISNAGGAQVLAVTAEGDTQAVRLEDLKDTYAAELANVSGDVYPDTAAGLAATSVGKTFQAMDGGERKLFLHETGPVATEIYVYPDKGSVEGLFTSNRTDALTVTSVVDVDGDQIAGIAADGRTFLSDALARPRLEVRLVGGREQIFACDHLGCSQLTYTSRNFAPEWLLGGMIRFTTDRAGLAETWVMGPDGDGKRRVSTGVWEDWQVCGQSLAIGSNTSDTGSTGLALTTTPATPQAYMPEITGGATPYGPRTHYDSLPTSGNFNLMLDVSKITGLTPLVEALYSSFGETVCSGFAAQYMRGAAADQRMVISSHGRGAAPWLENPSFAGTYIAPGSAHFANGQLVSMLVKKFVEAGGAWGDPGEYRRGGLIDLHGQNDATAGQGTTFEKFVQYQIDKVNAYNRHGRADSLVHRQRRMYSQQIASFVATYSNGYNIARAQAEAGMRDRRIIPFSSYEFLHGDQVHLRASGQRGLGEKMGMWARRIEREGMDMLPFVPHHVTLIGSTAYCEFPVPTPPIQIRTDLGVAAIANAGIVYADDSASGITVTGVPTVYDAQVLAVPLSSGSIGTNARLKFASAPTTANTSGPLTGARTNICDSETERGVLSGNLLTAWALTWEQEIGQ